MKKKSEKYFKGYLKEITNDQLIQYYNDLEWTPFPVLVIKEYQNRFKAKNKKEVLQKLKTHAELAKEKTKELKSFAKNRGSKVTKKISKKISDTKLISTEKNLKALEKLAELNKKNIITNKEFHEKKKEILKRI